ncbi:hypothetical protein Hypma_000405 [Hypsizygus marmoreus]|uniref:Uncharacterized protein n=1 Tax=Hypsizygus marmoreus TaxID=39966 RepID=A0A369J8F1_HYPMA|nr:hypothetical protein Hypma_000405 [Hypsizygus marmoreus]
MQGRHGLHNQILNIDDSVSDDLQHLAIVLHQGEAKFNKRLSSIRFLLIVHNYVLIPAPVTCFSALGVSASGANTLPPLLFRQPSKRHTIKKCDQGYIDRDLASKVPKSAPQLVLPSSAASFAGSSFLAGDKATTRTHHSSECAHSSQHESGHATRDARDNETKRLHLPASDKVNPTTLPALSPPPPGITWKLTWRAPQQDVNAACQ